MPQYTELDNFRHRMNKLLDPIFKGTTYQHSAWINSTGGEELFINFLVHWTDGDKILYYDVKTVMTKQNLKEQFDAIYDTFVMKCIKLFVLKMANADDFSKEVIETLLKEPGV